MEKEFVSYEQAVALKELGAGFPYIAWYLPNNPIMILHPAAMTTTDIPAPLKQQVFRWFREKYDIQGYIYSSTVRGNAEKTKQFTGYIWNINGIDMAFLSTDTRDELHDTYEKAENSCIDKLIELAKNKL